MGQAASSEEPDDQHGHRCGASTREDRREDCGARRPMKNDAVVDGHLLRVMSKRCDQCLYTEARVVSEERAEQIMRDCERRDRYFLCHKGTEPTVCRGFFDSGVNTLCRVARAMDAVLDVEPPRSK